jgi:hypothetical protein
MGSGYDFLEWESPLQREKKVNGKTVVASLLAIVLTYGAVEGGIAAFDATHPERDVTVTVTDKVRTGGDNSKYLIFTDRGTFENIDSMVKGKYNSSDLYGQIKVKHTYTFHVRGVRSEFWSMYPNVITAKELDK